MITFIFLFVKFMEVTLQEKIFYIHPTVPFNFNLTRRIVKSFFPTQENYKIINGNIVFSYNLANQLVIVAMKNLGTIDYPKIQIKLLSSKRLEDSEINKIKTKIIRQFSLKIVLSDFYEKLYNFDFLKHNFRKLYGYHPVSFSSIEEAGSWAILSQHSSFQQAYNQKKIISSRYSFKESIKSVDFQGFPNIEQLSSIPKESFIEITGDIKKVTYLSNFISTLSSVEIDNLYTFSYSNLLNLLVSIKGIGAWSSEFIILRGAANFEKVPLSEKANIKVFQKYYNEQIDKYISFYHTYGGLWIHYLRIYDYLNKGVLAK